MAQIDPIKRYRSFITRLKQHIYICPNCKQFFNENTPCECGYHYQEGRCYDYINEDGDFRTMTKELLCIKAKSSNFMECFNKADLTAIHDFFVISEWKYIMNNIHVTPSITDLQNTVKHLYQHIRFAKDASGIQSGGWELTKTDDNFIICKFIAKPIYKISR